MFSVPVRAYYLASQGRLFAFEGEQLLGREQADRFKPFAEAELSVGEGVGLLIVPAEVLAEAEEIALRALLASAADELMFAQHSRAAQLATWHDQHRFCGRCGTHMSDHEKDLARQCPQCHLTQYPRISPCVIVLVRRGDKCLLARAPHFAPGRFSTLAGFIEAGETAEQAVAREIMEEVGIEVGNVRFFASQSWPFPHQLMLGFFADHAAGELQPDGVEIVEADWFGVDELPDLPPQFSISRQLINHFFSEQISD
ncbi:NAD(+) diphosphatase [Marinobacterium stanieri]|uniref:NAD(+) diphosphatase n=1 Tax=Marinobacterium stanieri TaxID=49186 RepID=UPI0002558C47|nr:NAD(+) diphosphatase [Marinobacterium stanieri]